MTGKKCHLGFCQADAFGGINSVADFVDHERRAKSTNHRLESAWFGNGAMIK